MNMVEKIPQIDTFGKLMRELDEATSVMNALKERGSSSISQQEMNHLVKTFQQFNQDFADKGNFNIFAGKSMIQEKMNESITNYLRALEVFKHNFPQNPAIQRDVGQTMVNLFYSLAEEMKKFGKILRELKDRKNIKIGQKVEKTSKSKLLKEKK